MIHVRCQPEPSAARRRRCRGGTLIEVMVASVLLSTVLVTVFPLLGRATTIRREAARRQLAVEAATNILERLATGNATPEAAAALVLPDVVRTQLPGVRLQVVISDIEGVVPSRRAEVSIAWLTQAGGPANPVTLVAWLHVSGNPAP